MFRWNHLNNDKKGRQLISNIDKHWTIQYCYCFLQPILNIWSEKKIFLLIFKQLIDHYFCLWQFVNIALNFNQYWTSKLNIDNYVPMYFEFYGNETSKILILHFSVYKMQWCINPLFLQISLGENPVQVVIIKSQIHECLMCRITGNMH
jgi:hypothetical protein